MNADNDSQPESWQDARAGYLDRWTADKAIVDKNSMLTGRINMIRGSSLLISFVLFVLWLTGNGQFWMFASVVGAVAFFVIAFIHQRIEDELEEAKIRASINRQGYRAIERDWDKLPHSPVEIPASFLPVSNDLDLLGRRSLFQMVSRAHTPFGQKRLSNWISTPAGCDEIVKRQQAVKELTPLAEFREQFALAGKRLASSQTGPDAFVEWAEESTVLGRRRWLVWLARVVAALMLLAMVLLLTKLIDVQIVGVAILGMIFFNFAVTVFVTSRIHGVFNTVSSRHHDVVSYRRLFQMIESLPGDCDEIRQLKSELESDDGEALHQIQSLCWIMNLANIRRSGIFFLIYLGVQFSFLWDIHMLHLLEKWQAVHGSHVRRWFEAVGRLEALLSLAQLAHDHPTWNFPIVSNEGSEKRIVAQEIGHPLIPNDQRTCNDVSVGPQDSMLLVTGSNMSGKSTLLRSLGVNTVLAQTGSVVCAKEMSLPRLEIQSSMRISDSLADGVSFFMAELKRLKQIVDRASQLRNDDGLTLFYLLDEILQGTNSRERHIAVSRVACHLLENEAIGAISTHDLDLASASGLKDHCHNIHFRETFQEVDGVQKMTFDYQLQQGVSTTTNAIRLLEIVGLGEAEAEK